MKTPLEVIKGYGAPTDSFIAAMNFFRYQKAPMTKQQHESGIVEIIGVPSIPPFATDKEAEVYFLYTVQETIRAHQTGVIPDMDEVWNNTFDRATKFIVENPWCFKDYSEEDPILDEDGNVIPKSKKGEKKEWTEDLYKKMNDGTNDSRTIIQAFITELGLSKGCATTYFHNLKKEHKFKGPKTERKKKEKKEVEPKLVVEKKKKEKGISKGKVAEQIYLSMPGADKADVIAAIVKATGTSPAGANTYYCQAKKAHS